MLMTDPGIVRKTFNKNYENYAHRFCTKYVHSVYADIRTLNSGKNCNILLLAPPCTLWGKKTAPFLLSQ